MDVDRDYLWDRTGEPDAGVERLEETLAVYRPPLPPLLPLPARGTIRPRRAAMVVPLATAAAVTLLVAAAGWFALSSSRRGDTVAAAGGAPRVAGDTIEGHGRLRAGDWL